MVYLTVVFDIPIARQVLGFIYFTFLPGFIILKLLKLDELDRVETFLFSVGLSVAFLMLTGLLINESSVLLDISRPLSLLPLMLILNGFILVGGILACLRSDSVKLWEAKTLELHLLTLVLTGLPILSIVGAMWVNAFANNVILLFMLLAISALFVITVVSKKLISPKLYPIVLFIIAISLLYHSSLVSNYLVAFGSDVPVEYFVFKTTQNNAYWSLTNPFGDVEYDRIHSMLSVTILPTIYSSLLNIDSTWVFKIVSPLIFSFVPLGLYQVWTGYMGKKYAFISTFPFMAYATFYNEMLGLNRQMIAELFFVLLLLVVLNKKMRQLSKMACFIIFSFGLVTSHYGVSEVFLFFISLIFVSLVLVKRPSRNITANMVVFFFVTMFAWYIYTSGSAVFNCLLGFGDYVYSQLGEFFNPAARGQTVLRGLGLESPPTIWNAISRTFAYAMQFLIVIGFFGLVTKRKKSRLDNEHFAFSCVAVAFLAALILVPGLANTMNMTRFYHVLLFFLAPLCVIGAEFIVELMFKREKEFAVSALLLIVLVPYFLFQTGFVYEITGTQSWSLPLSKHRMDAVFLNFYIGYSDECNVYGALWMSKNVDIKTSRIYADDRSLGNVLISYGMICRTNTEVLSNVTKLSEKSNIYLSRLNVVNNVVIGIDLWNTTSILQVFNFTNLVYSNGECVIYKNQ
jgi:uncharacterized membrane protein